MAQKPKPAKPIKKGRGGRVIPRPSWLDPSHFDMSLPAAWQYPFLDSKGIDENDLEIITLFDGNDFRVGRLGTPFTKNQAKQVFAAASAEDASAVTRVILAMNHERRKGGTRDTDIASARRYMRNMGVRNRHREGMVRTLTEMAKTIFSVESDGRIGETLSSIVGTPVWRQRRGFAHKSNFINGADEWLADVINFVRGENKFGLDLYRVNEILLDIERTAKAAEIPDKYMDGAEVFIYPKLNLSNAYWEKARFSIRLIELCLRRYPNGVWTYTTCRQPSIGKGITSEYGEWRVTLPANAEVFMAKYGLSKIGMNVMPSAFYGLHQQVQELKGYPKGVHGKRQSLLMYEIARNIATMSRDNEAFRNQLAEALFPDNYTGHLDF